MELKDNPLLQPENYMAGYQESIDELKNRPELVSMDKLCYELFAMTDLGKKFMEVVQETFIDPPLADRNAPDFTIKVIWAEGVKDAFRTIKMHMKSHEQRIKAGESK